MMLWDLLMTVVTAKSHKVVKMPGIVSKVRADRGQEDWALPILETLSHRAIVLMSKTLSKKCSQWSFKWH